MIRPNVKDNLDLRNSLRQIERDAAMNDPRNKAMYDPKRSSWLRGQELKDLVLGKLLLLAMVIVAIGYLLIFS